ncbi:serine hydrolase domain-containing protein [Thalassotalea atypica]|uniref:serine hydrolase domain-containing protein n=1 Tax=Thalassotalea atypica TaxID=2054316 RepID=UPI002572B0E7|nr:serine hydrolase domain-containing protein [Thalassotalea atypica]
MIKTNINKPIYIKWIALFLCCHSIFACQDSEKSESAEYTGVQESITSTIETYLDANQEDDTAGVSIIVRKDGNIAYKGNRGMANTQTGIAISSSTGFRLASVSKPFTALAIMQLYEQGAIGLEDKLLHYIPELSPIWKEITIHHLLSHQSGIPDFLNDIWSSSRNDGLTNQGLINYFAQNDELEFIPGVKGDYSNTGYVLLAEIVARVSGMSFSDYMQAHIFGPTGMVNSYITNELMPIKDGDALNFADRNTYHGIKLYTYGSMAQVSSSDDLNLFAQALLNDEIVSQETLALVLETHSIIEGVGGYGYGFQVEDFFAHSGLWDSFNTLLIFFPNEQLEIIFLSNGGEPTDKHMSNIHRLIREFYGIN